MRTECVSHVIKEGLIKPFHWNSHLHLHSYQNCTTLKLSHDCLSGWVYELLLILTYLFNPSLSKQSQHYPSSSLSYACLILSTPYKHLLLCFSYLLQLCFSGNIFSISEAHYHLALQFHAPAIYRDRYTLGGRGSCAQSAPPFRIETFATPPPTRTSGLALQMQSR